MDACDARAEAEARALTYSFLSRMFLEEATAEFLRRLMASPSDVEGELGRYAGALSSANLEAARVDAAAEFSALLLNMSANPVSPYESVRTSEKRLMMQEARDQVLAAYRAEGFERSEGLRVPEDHVGIEFEFMARLCRKEAEAWESSDAGEAAAAREAQRRFLRNHLLRWVPPLCADLERRAKTGLYRGLAETTRLHLAFEREALGIDQLKPT